MSDKFYILIKKAKYAIYFEMEGLPEDNTRRASDSSKAVLWARKLEQRWSHVGRGDEGEGWA